MDCRISRARNAKDSPAGVTSMERPVRLKSLTPSSASNLAIAREKAGCVVNTVSAARVKLP